MAAAERSRMSLFSVSNRKVQTSQQTQFRPHHRPLWFWFHHHASLPYTICTPLSPSVLVFFSIAILWEHICILNARLGGGTDQQNVIMHKGYSSETFCPLKFYLKAKVIFQPRFPLQELTVTVFTRLSALGAYLIFWPSGWAGRLFEVGAYSIFTIFSK